MNAKEAVERLFIGITGASLAVNAWFMASKMIEVSDTLEKISEKIGDLREAQAAIEAEVRDHSNELATLLRTHTINKDD